VATTSPMYQFGDFTLDTQKGCLLKGTREIKLRPKVYETLKYLVQNPGRLIAKPELMQAVWPHSFVTDDSLVQCTLELRRAPSRSSPWRIGRASPAAVRGAATTSRFLARP
jgi:DNA-binding winged helix-turn-helix (wHTH) protein